MKKLTIFFLSFILLLTVFACAGGQSTVTNRGTLSVAYDNAKTADLLGYFQANQNVIVTGTLLNDETDYETLTAAVALVKDIVVVEKLLAAGWTETDTWTESQKETNATMFNFTVLVKPDASAADKAALKYLTDWLVGDGSYDRTITTASGSCSCKREETTVIMKSDAPALFKSGTFSELAN